MIVEIFPSARGDFLAEVTSMKRLAMITLIGLASVNPAWGADVRHSGRVVTIDPGDGRLRLEELIAAPGPEPRSVELQLQVTRDTAINRVARAAMDTAGRPNAWRGPRTPTRS